MTWTHLDTRRGQLLEMAATLRNGARIVRSVMDDYPPEACGSAWLEQALKLISESESDITYAADQEPRS